MERGTAVHAFRKLIAETCYECGVLFGIESDHRQTLLRTKRNFCCPNGHQQHYTGEPDKARAERLERELEETQRRNHDRAQHQENVIRVLKGHRTRLKKRIANGVCPCYNRSFANLHAHMTTQHPDYAKQDLG